MKNLVRNLCFKSLLGKTAIFCLFVFQVGDTFSQNVGINQPNPLWPLDITGPHGVIRVVTTNSNYGSTLELKNNNAAAEYMGVINFNDAGNSYPGQISYKSGHDLLFNTFYQEQMRIDINGNVGIGNQAPQFPLDVSAPQGVNRLVSTNHTDGSVVALQNNTPSPNI